MINLPQAYKLVIQHITLINMADILNILSKIRICFRLHSCIVLNNSYEYLYSSTVLLIMLPRACCIMKTTHRVSITVQPLDKYVENGQMVRKAELQSIL